MRKWAKENGNGLKEKAKTKNKMTSKASQGRDSSFMHLEHPQALTHAVFHFFSTLFYSNKSSSIYLRPPPWTLRLICNFACTWK